MPVHLRRIPEFLCRVAGCKRTATRTVYDGANVELGFYYCEEHAATGLALVEQLNPGPVVQR